MGELIEGVQITSLKKIDHPKGQLFHALKASESSFSTFGEAYFSSITFRETKGWKKHTLATLNFVVPHGEILVEMVDARTESRTYGAHYSIELGTTNYSRLTIPPQVWVAFTGVSEHLNLLLNISSLEHDASEAKNMDYGLPLKMVLLE